MSEPIFIGVDLGTGGVRAVAATEKGDVVAQSAASLDRAVLPSEPGRHEQDPNAWWTSASEATQGLLSSLSAAGIGNDRLRAIAVDGTSGTLVCLDRDGTPVRSAIMYNDGRASDEARDLTHVADAFCQRLGYRFEASYALSKALWVQRNEPDTFGRTVRSLHQGDFIEGCLTGNSGTSDYSNALKTGYDLVEERWPDWLDQFSGLRERLPDVVAPGTRIGTVSDTAAENTGLPAGLPVIAGATDGTAACLASGVRRPGDYNTTLGTTLVFKGIATEICRHPDGLIYSHKLPGGLWLPGAASNTGAEWIEHLFPNADPATLDAQAQSALPSACIAYPLARTGERFPFAAAEAEGFCVPEVASEVANYAARLQGTALVERLAYEVLDKTADTRGGDVYCTGGGSRSDVWSQCRADATGRVLHRPACPESAFGSAILAATGVHFGDVWDAIESMVRVERTFEPSTEHKARYDTLFAGLTKELDQRGYTSS